MNDIDIANGMIFQSLGLKKENFDERLICQKKMYLLQSLGTDLGYSYNWYVRGPYSPSLTTYIYNNLDMLKPMDFSEYQLEDDAKQNIQTINSLISDMPPGMNNVSWYELLASLTYIYKNKQSWNVHSNETLIEKLLQYKPQYDTNQCSDAIDSLGRTGLIVKEQ